MMSYPQQGFAPPGARFATLEPAAKRPRFEGAGAGQAVAEVRFSDVNATQQALTLNGSALEGQAISVELDARSKDGTKIIVRNLPDGIDFRRLKDFFGQCGPVAFADVKRVSSTPITGQVRFSTPEQAQAALELNGTVLDGHEIAMKVHAGSKDGTKLQIFNIPPHMEWQELKDFFNQNGLPPIFCEATSAESITAEVRFADAQMAQHAVTSLNGGILGGAQIQVVVDQMSSDQTKLVVSNIPAGIEWQELKDHFGQCGTVAFVRTSEDKSGKGSAKGKGVGKGKAGSFVAATNPIMQQMQMMQMQLQMLQQKAAKGGCFGPGFAAAGAGFGGKGAMNFACGKGKGKGSAVATTGQGEVRYSNALEAQTAIATLSGTDFKGSRITVGVDMTSQDGTKVWITGIPLGTSWQELKEHFTWAGAVAFANVK